MKKSEQTKKAAAELVLAGTSISKVAKTYGASWATVRKWVKTYGVQDSIRPRLEVPPPSAFPKLGNIHSALNTLKEAGLI